MNEQARGLKVEAEHSSTIKTIIADARAGKVKPLKHYLSLVVADHHDEISDYYARLTEMEKEAKKGKDSEDEAQERSDKAFESWQPTATKSDNKPTAIVEHEIWYPQVDLKLPKCDFKIGADVEVTFKACVKSLNQSKDGCRVCFELKEFKFE